jgi:hypothetical protein
MWCWTIETLESCLRAQAMANAPVLVFVALVAAVAVAGLWPRI